MTQLTSSWSDLRGKCPVSGVDLDYRPFEHHGMYAFFAEAREAAPVFYCPEIGYWVVTRREDILPIFRDPDRFSAAIALSPVKPLSEKAVALMQTHGYGAEPTQVNCDRPKHTRIRKFAGQLLAAKHYAKLEPGVRDLVREFCAALEGRPRVDMVRDFAYDLPARVIFLMLGIPDEDTPKIKEWADNRLLLTFGELSEEAQIAAAEQMVDYWNYCTALVDDRMARPRDDYASQLLAMRAGDDDRLTINEVCSLVFGLLLAGHETTTNMTTNALHALLSHREQWEAICADPSLIPNAVEEVLRFASSVVCWRRRTLEPVEIAGDTIPEGENILLALGSANTDEAHFEDPLRLDISRENARDHLSFGNGTHFCLGAPLARIELRIILEELTRCFPNMTLADGEPLDYIRTIAFRGPEHLWVDLNGAS